MSASMTVIVIGASAGGVDAIRTIVGALPETLDAAVFVTLHIGAHQSDFPWLLDRIGTLSASHAEQGEAIRAGHIFVAPPDQHMTIEPGKVVLTRGPRENMARPAIDPMFRSAARIYGADVIGVILTGGLNDGTAGLFEVNLLAPAELVRQALPGMVARGRGHVVDVSSGFSTVSAPGLVPYAASKAGMSHFHAGVRTELRGSGVGTTLVEPGPVRTGMWDDIVAQGLASAALRRFQRLQLAVLSEPADVARKTLDAVEAGKPHVVLPRRMTPVMVFGWLPRRVSDLALLGVPRR